MHISTLCFHPGGGVEQPPNHALRCVTCCFLILLILLCTNVGAIMHGCDHYSPSAPRGGQRGTHELSNCHSPRSPLRVFKLCPAHQALPWTDGDTCTVKRHSDPPPFQSRHKHVKQGGGFTTKLLKRWDFNACWIIWRLEKKVLMSAEICSEFSSLSDGNKKTKYRNTTVRVDWWGGSLQRKWHICHVWLTNLSFLCSFNRKLSACLILQLKCGDLLLIVGIYDSKTKRCVKEGGWKRQHENRTLFCADHFEAKD